MNIGYKRMGYDVHITRKKEWSDEDGPRITEDEWQAYVASDADMIITGFAEQRNQQGETIRITQPLLTQWRKHSRHSPVWRDGASVTGGTATPGARPSAPLARSAPLRPCPASYRTVPL